MPFRIFQAIPSVLAGKVYGRSPDVRRPSNANHCAMTTRPILAPSGHPSMLGGASSATRALASGLLVFGMLAATTRSAVAHAHTGPPPCERVSLPVALEPGAELEHVVVAELCLPPGRTATLQILLSGATYGRSYWDPPLGSGRSSYVQAMTRKGLATLNVDRLGVGDSAHPPAAQLTVSAHAYVLHQLVDAARDGTLGAAFERVVLVGHSLGSAIALVEAARYGDVDALVLSGFLAHAAPVGAPALIASLQPAQLETRFASLPPGYLTTRPGTRGDLFYHRPGADAEMIALDEQTKETVSGAELATLGQASDADVSEAISVPVLSVVGEYDNVFCLSSCAESSSPAFAEAEHYPNAPCFSSAVTSAAGHAVNLHRTAPHFFALARTWVLRLDRSSTLCR